MRKLMALSTACLVVITLLLARREWADYRRAREAEAAVALMEKIKPPRFRTLPGPEGETDPTPQERLVVTLDIRGGVRLGDEDVGTLADLAPLREKLTLALGRRGPPDRPDRTVYVRAPQSMKYAEVSKVVEAVRQAGADPVGLEIDYSK